MNTPKIRFKGFTGDWKKRKLGEYVKIYSGESPSKFEAGDELYVKVDDLNYNTKYITETQNKVSLHNTVHKVPKGSVAFPKRGAAIMTNKVRILAEDSYMDTNMMALSSDRINLEFLYNVISKEGLYRIADTSTIPQINNKHIEPYEVILPELEEQIRIGKLFENLDNLITLHQRKCDSLKQVKKYMLQKMFPKQGEQVPEIRFAEFTDDWEQRKLGELGNFKNGMNFSKDAMDKGYPFVNLQNIFGKNVIDIDNLGLAEASDKQLKEYNLQEGDVLFVRSSVKLEGVGEAAIVPKRLENTTYSGFVIRFRDESDMDTNYKRFVFGTNSIRNQIMAKATNSANKNISQDVLINLEICVPSKEEQRKIGKYFVNLDNLITLHQRKSDNLKEIKKFMLQNMFPRE